jgi:hypothetical protein
VPTSRDLVRERGELVDHRVDRVLEPEDLALRVHGDLLGEIARCDRSRDLRDVADLVGQVGRHAVHRFGEAAPCSRDALDLGLTAELALRAHFLRNAGHLGGEHAQGVDHGVDRVRELRDLAFRLDRELLVEVAVCDGGDDARDAAHLCRQVRGHEVDVVGEVLPGAANALDLSLAAELAFSSDFARNACHLVRERAQLVDHRVDRVLELAHFALDVDGDLLAQVAVGHGRRHVGDVAHLRRQVRRHEVHVVREIAPDSGRALDPCLTAEDPFGADLAGDACHLGREGAQLVEHRVHGRADAEELAAHRLPLDLQGHLLREVAFGDRIEDA